MQDEHQLMRAESAATLHPVLKPDWDNRTSASPATLSQTPMAMPQNRPRTNTIAYASPTVASRAKAIRQQNLGGGNEGQMPFSISR